MNIEQIVTQCRELRAAFERDEARFFLGLVEIERTCMQTITDAGHESFDVFIKRHELCEPTRYRTFAKGLSLTTREKAEELGTHAVMELASTREPRNVPKFEEAVSAWRNEHGGVAPSRETARRLLRQVDPRPEVPSVVKVANELDRLRAENQALRAENQDLRRKLALAEKRVAKGDKAPGEKRAAS